MQSPFYSQVLKFWFELASPSKLYRPARKGFHIQVTRSILFFLDFLKALKLEFAVRIKNVIAATKLTTKDLVYGAICLTYYSPI